MLLHIHRLMAQTSIDFSEALQNHADVYRKTSFYNLKDPSMTRELRPDWDRCAAQLASIMERSLYHKSSPSEAEDAGFALLEPYLNERIERGLPIIDYRQTTSFGCFFYETQASVLDLHFINRVMPASPFANIHERVIELTGLLSHCLQTNPNLKTIKFGSWLNDYPPYRKLFPASWHDSGERKKYNSFAWWGQFMNRQGDIHASNAEVFRETGNFPYQCTFHQCTIQDLQLHLGEMMENKIRYA